MKTPWEPHFDFYVTLVDDRPASITVDMSASPIDTHTTRLQFRVPLERPNADGLRDQAEFDAMCEVEDVLVAKAEQLFEAIYVGRIVADGATEFFFYVPDGKAADLSPVDSIELRAPYELQYLAAADPSWTLFSELLLPDAYNAQFMGNRRVLQQLEQHGDQLSVPRVVDHFAYFETEARAAEAAEALRREGFDVDPINRAKDGRSCVPFHRKQALDGQQADEVVAQILDVLLPLDGDYDGWGCPIVKG